MRPRSIAYIPVNIMPHTLELKPFIPARDFDISCRFYRELGFEEQWRNEALAELRIGATAFLLQDFYRKDWAQNCVMHLLVEDVNSWWREIKQKELLEHFSGSRAIPPEDKPWGVRQFSLMDPSGVLWHIGQVLAT
ncbi:VOC family protein [Chitinimonas naiadis]